jgi:hypothetical protein
MKKVVERERNKGYYRVLHVPIWIWVFFILPGNLTSDLYAHGADRRHWIWLLIVTVVCAWRGLVGRLPGGEPKPYITHYGVDQPNLPYRVVCYTAAWIDLLVPFALNAIGLTVAVFTGRWVIEDLYVWLYYPLLALIVLATLLDWTPRAKRSTKFEGSEKGWFYVAIWTVVPTQSISWAMWRLGKTMALSPTALAHARFATFFVCTALFFALGWMGRLPRTERYHPQPVQATAD